MRARKKPVEIGAFIWNKNGDHPRDNCTPVVDEQGEIFLSEGNIVKYYRRPSLDGTTKCKHCNETMHHHGWIDTLEGGHIVCPGDVIITEVNDEHYPCKPHIFEKTYDIISYD